jgi:hypothetical protein
LSVFSSAPFATPSIVEWLPQTGLIAAPIKTGYWPSM